MNRAGDLIPPGWAAQIARLGPEDGPSGAAWLEALPGMIEQSLDQWQLRITGSPMTGHTSIALPVARADESLMLKVRWPHAEAHGEHLALRRWAGDGAVRLVAANPARGALLLEPLHTEDLNEVWDEDAVAVIAGLLVRLHVPALPAVRRLSDVLEAGVSRHLLDSARIPRRFVQQGRVLYRELRDDPLIDSTLVHADLHFGNVLAADREPWLAIDPKPMAGHPAWEIAPILVNRVAEMGTGGSLRWSVRRRIDIVCEALGLEEDIARAWTTLRLITEAAADAVTGDADWVGVKITILKTLQ